MHVPYQCLLTHCFLLAVGGRLVELGTFAVVGEGSTQIKPNHSLLLQSSVAVAVWVFFADEDVEVGFGAAEVVVGSSQPPNQPGVLQVLVLVLVMVVVTLEPGAAVVVVVMVEEVVVVMGSLQPNQPGVLHVLVDVDEVLDDEVVVVAPVVVDSSRHPHHPGVLHVSVLVRDVEVLVLDVVVVDSVPLLS